MLFLTRLTALLAMVVGGCASNRSTVEKTAEELRAEDEACGLIDRESSELIASVEAKAAEPGVAPWEGVYNEGGLGATIRLGVSGRVGAAYRWHGCMGLFGAGVGEVAESGDHLRVSFERAFGNQRTGYDCLYPVAWGARHYLITVEQMPAFCADVRRGYEPRKSRTGMYLLRCGDERLSAVGEPQVSERFRPLLAGAGGK